MGVAARRKYFAIGRTVDDVPPDNLLDISAYLTDLSLSLTRASEMDTTYDPTGARRFEQSRILLLRDGSLSGSGRWQPDAHRLLTRARASVLASDSGEALHFDFGPGGTAAGAVRQSGQLILSSYSINIPKMGISEYTLQGQLVGAVTEATDGFRGADTAAFRHGVAGYRAAVLIGGYDASRWLDTYAVQGTVGTLPDGGFRPPGDQAEYLTSLGDHTFSASGPWLAERHQRLIGYLGDASGQIVTLCPEGHTAGVVALIFRSLQTQYDLQGRYDDRLSYQLSMEAGDSTAIDGVLLAAGAEVDAAEAVGAVCDMGEHWTPAAHGVLSVHVTGPTAGGTAMTAPSDTITLQLWSATARADLASATAMDAGGSSADQVGDDLTIDGDDLSGGVGAVIHAIGSTAPTGRYLRLRCTALAGGAEPVLSAAYGV